MNGSTASATSQKSVTAAEEWVSNEHQPRSAGGYVFIHQDMTRLDMETRDRYLFMTEHCIQRIS